MAEKWIIPCSTKFFNVVNHFEINTNIVWRRTTAIHKDDIVYIYVGKPYSEIKYRCRVLDECVTNEVINKNEYAIPKDSTMERTYMLLTLEYTFPSGALGFHDLKKHGLNQVQKQARVYKELLEYIDNKEVELS